jgi:hypothetical protein
MKGETTVERYGRKPKPKSRVSLLDTPKKKLNLEYSLLVD